VQVNCTSAIHVCLFTGDAVLLVIESVPWLLVISTTGCFPDDDSLSCWGNILSGKRPVAGVFTGRWSHINFFNDESQFMP